MRCRVYSTKEGWIVELRRRQNYAPSVPRAGDVCLELAKVSIPRDENSDMVPTRSSSRMLVLLLLPLHSHGAITMQHTAAPLLRAPPLQLRQLRVQPRQLRMVTNYGSLEDDDGACSVRGLRDGEICWEPLDPLPSAEKPDYFELPLNESWSPLRAASLRFARVRKLAYQAMGSPLLLLPAACFSWWLLPVLSNLDFFQRSLQATQAGRDSIGSIEGPPRPPSEAAPA
jgi:hypothetical protein